MCVFHPAERNRSCRSRYQIASKGEFLCGFPAKKSVFCGEGRPSENETAETRSIENSWHVLFGCVRVRERWKTAVVWHNSYRRKKVVHLGRVSIKSVYPARLFLARAFLNTGSAERSPHQGRAHVFFPIFHLDRYARTTKKKKGGGGGVGRGFETLPTRKIRNFRRLCCRRRCCCWIDKTARWRFLLFIVWFSDFCLRHSANFSCFLRAERIFDD